MPAFSPHGIGALHVAVYATLTRALERYATLVAAGREFMLVCTLLSAVLLWRTARRLGLGDVASAVAVLLAGAVPLLSVITAVDSPAQVAVPWLLLAAWLLAHGGPSPAAIAVALLATTVAVLLAPGTLLLVLAGAAAASMTGTLMTGNLPGRLSEAGRLIPTLVPALLFIAVAFLLGRWDPQPETAVTWAAQEPAVLGVAAALVAVGILAAWRLPRFRAAGVALVATTAAAVALPGRLAVLLVCLPLAAILTAALLQAWARPVLGARERLRRTAVAAGALALAGGAATALVVLLRAPHPDLGARDQSALLSWAGNQLSSDARLVAPVRLWAELVHAGGDEDQFRLPGTAGQSRPLAPVVTVMEDGGPGDLLVAAFGTSESAPPLVVIDPSRSAPTPAELEHRRALAAAILANPTTSVTAEAADVLESGQVDPRLLSLLAALTGQFGLGLQSLPPALGESLRHTAAREAVVSSLMGRPLTPGIPLTDRLVAYLDAQVPPFAPDRVQVARNGVRIAFHYVSAPDALVTGATP